LAKRGGRKTTVAVRRHRCFVSLDLPAALRDAAVAGQSFLRTKEHDLRYTAVSNLHLTLKFLGEISPDDRAEVRKRLGLISPQGVSLRLVRAGCFAPRIVWLAVHGADELQRQVDQALEGLFEPERRFMGHITIARTKGIPDALKMELGDFVVPVLDCPVSSFSLQESHLSHLGPRYETVARFALTES